MNLGLVVYMVLFAFDQTICPELWVRKIVNFFIMGLFFIIVISIIIKNKKKFQPLSAVPVTGRADPVGLRGRRPWQCRRAMLGCKV